MLNLVAHDIEDDKESLENSYNAIKQKDCLEIVPDEAEKESVLKKVKTILTIPTQAMLSFQNLFKLRAANGQFYISQCLIDFGYTVSGRLVQSANSKYNFQLVGIANIKFDLGKTLLRPETLADKIVGGFFGNDIDFDNAEKFSDKYYVVSDKKQFLRQSLDLHFLSTIAKHEGLVLLTKGNDMLLTFETSLEEKQSAIVEDVLSNCRFLSD